MIVDRKFVHWMLLMFATGIVIVLLSWGLDYRANSEYLNQHSITHTNQAEIIRLLKARTCHG